MLTNQVTLLVEWKRGSPSNMATAAQITFSGEQVRNLLSGYYEKKNNHHPMLNCAYPRFCGHTEELML